MMPRGLDLEMEGRHIVEEPGEHEVVRVCTGHAAVRHRKVQETRDGLHRLQESRHTELVE